MPFAVAAAAVAVALAGLTVAVHSAQPGDAMFGLTKVFFSQQADNATKAQEARATIEQANQAIRRGDPATAQSLLQSAAGQIQAVQPADQPPLQQQREDTLKSLAPQPPASSSPSSTAPNASNGATPEGTTQSRDRRHRPSPRPVDPTVASQPTSPESPVPASPSPDPGTDGRAQPSPTSEPGAPPASPTG
jgi:hypothetical protein